VQSAGDKLVRASRNKSAALEEAVPAGDGGTTGVVGRRESKDRFTCRVAADCANLDLKKRRAESEADGDGRVGDAAASGGVAAGDGEGGVGRDGCVVGVGVAGEVAALSVEDGGCTHAAGDSEVGEGERAAVRAVESDVAVVDRETGSSDTGGWGQGERDGGLAVARDSDLLLGELNGSGLARELIGEDFRVDAVAFKSVSGAGRDVRERESDFIIANVADGEFGGLEEVVSIVEADATNAEDGRGVSSIVSLDQTRTLLSSGCE